MATPTITQSPGIANLSFYPGDDLSFSVTIQDSAGVAINLTGYTIDASISCGDNPDSSHDFSYTIPTPTNGTVLLSMANTITSQIVDGSKWYFKIISSAGVTHTLLLGQVSLQQL